MKSHKLVFQFKLELFTKNQTIEFSRLATLKPHIKNNELNYFGDYTI